MKTSRIQPNFFIIGAPKCGTTALAAYLMQHKDVYMTDPKEPNYFSFDLPMTQKGLTDIDAYLSLFDAATGGEKIFGEASVWYLYSKVAVENIYQEFPGSKFIIMIRNPIEQVVSMHSQHLYVGIEGEEDFEKAWNRQFGKQDVDVMLQYAEIASFSEQLKRVRSIIPASDLKIIFLDDMKSDPKAVYEDVIDFLGLSSDGRDDFPVINQRKKVRSYLLRKFIYDTPRPLVNFAKMTKKILGIEEIGIMKRLIALNTKKINPESPMSKYPFLGDYFDQEITALEGLLERDLGCWRTSSK